MYIILAFFFFFFRILSHFYVGSMCLMRRLHWTWSCASSPDSSLSDKSFLMLSNHLLWSSSPSFPRHLHRHHSLAYVFVFSSQYVPIPLQPTFLHFLGYFSHLRCPCNSFIPIEILFCFYHVHFWQNKQTLLPHLLTPFNSHILAMNLTGFGGFYCCKDTVFSTHVFPFDNLFDSNTVLFITH